MPRRLFAHLLPAAALSGLLSALLSHESAAQSVRGKVLELLSSRPVPDAQVLLFSDSITVAAMSRTDSTGTFLIRAPAPGTYNIRVRKLGYMGGETGNLALTQPETYEITIRTPRQSPVLPNVRVSGQYTRGYEWLQGFEERRKAGIGTFITQEQINDKNSPTVGELLRGVSGVGVAPGPNGWYLITSTRGGRSLENSACLMDVYMDGIPMDQEAIQQSTRPVDLEAIEVYNGPSTVPSQYKKQMTGSCGVVLLWTRVRNTRRTQPAKP